MPYGYTGKVLRVNLADGTTRVEEPDDLFYRRYWGGQGLATYYLLREQAPGVDPLGPENLLIFATGVMTGARLPAMPRFSVAARSPLTGTIGGSEAGGWWGPECKAAGFDAIILSGKAAKPVYLYLKDGRAELRDARQVWGLTIGDAADAIRAELGEPRARIAAIGPAGENLVRYACVVNENKHTNGRGGLGAVMGSKNLKAIVARGTAAPAAHDPKAVGELARWYAGQIAGNPTVKTLFDAGTPGLVSGLEAGGTLPTRNFHSGSFAKAGAVNWDAYEKAIFAEAKGCFACPIRCKREVHPDPEYGNSGRYGGPEYETMGALGPNCEIDDLRAIAKGHEICNSNGLDSISAGTTISFLMECFENGLVTKADCDGLEPRFGDARVMLALLDKIVRREGIGDLLAEGSARAAQKIGRGAERFAMQVKGQELAMHEPRGRPAMGLGTALSDTGADHLTIPHDPAFVLKESATLKTLAPYGILEPVPQLDLGPRKVRLYRVMEDVYNYWRAAGVCLFGYGPRVGVSIEKYAEMARAVTGWDVSLFEMAKVGERVLALSRAFNAREGFGRKDDVLPERFFEPLEGGRLAGKALSRDEFERALTLTYQMRGWDPATGLPTAAKLAELDIPWVVDNLRQAGVALT